MNNSSKKLTEAITLVDRISNLPDDLLLHILSFLKTKQAVATSILSKRWQFVWTYVDTLELTNRFDRTSDEDKPYILVRKEQYKQFVRKVLERHRAPLIKRIEIFCVRLLATDDLDYVTWIQTVTFSKNVQSLNLCFLNEYNDNIKWRLCFFSSNTLVKLRLEHADITNIMESPTAPFFPNLKKLYLYEARINTDSLSRFISACSILEDFCLYYHSYYLWETCCISSATLKELDLYNCVRIELNTPALEVLGIREATDWKLLVESSMPSLHEVHISMTLSGSDDFSFLKIISNVSVLCLEVTEYTDDSDDLDDFEFDLPVHFHNLTKLEIIVPWKYMDLLRFFMEHSNNLQVITLGKALDDMSEVIWEEPQQVPKCLLSSLRTICIKEYENEEEMDLVIKYLLANAKVLEHVTLQYEDEDDYQTNLHMLQKISNFPRVSKICELASEICERSYYFC